MLLFLVFYVGVFYVGLSSAQESPQATVRDLSVTTLCGLCSPHPSLTTISMWTSDSFLPVPREDAQERGLPSAQLFLIPGEQPVRHVPLLGPESGAGYSGASPHCGVDTRTTVLSAQPRAPHQVGPHKMEVTSPKVNTPTDKRGGLAGEVPQQR